MYSKWLIDTYKTNKNMTQYKQVAMELGFSKSFISMVVRGEREITDETGIYIAKECDLDIDEVLINLQFERARTPETKSAWKNIIKKLSEHGYAVQSLAVAGFGLYITGFSNCALCAVTVNKRLN